MITDVDLYYQSCSQDSCRPVEWIFSNTTDIELDCHSKDSCYDATVTVEDASSVLLRVCSVIVDMR